MFLFFFFNDTATTEIYTLSLHDALPISLRTQAVCRRPRARGGAVRGPGRGRPSGRGAGPGAAAPRSRPLATSPGHRVARRPDGAGAPQRPAGGVGRGAGRVWAAGWRGGARTGWVCP